MKINYELRRVTDDDYDFIYNVKKDAYKRYVEIYYGSWDEQSQREYFNSFFNKYKNESFIITLNGKKIGFMNSSFVDNKYEIGNICIITEYQNRGIGTNILSNLISQNIDKEIYLQYFKINPVGRLYERLGFKVIDETKYHYIMKKNK